MDCLSFRISKFIYNQSCRCRNNHSHNGSFHFHGLRPANRGGYVYITDDPDYIANSSYFYWKVGRIGQDATFVLLEIDACALARTQPIMRVLEHHEFAVPAVSPEYLTPV